MNQTPVLSQHLRFSQSKGYFKKFILPNFQRTFFRRIRGSPQRKILRTRAFAICCLSLYSGQFFAVCWVWQQKNFQKACAPAFTKAGARCICGYEIWESSKHIRCPYTPEKWAFQPYSRYAHFDFGGSPKPLIFKMKILPELFRKVLAFIRFADYNYTVIL